MRLRQKPPKQHVSGKVLDKQGNPVTDATVTISQNGSTVDSLTTNSTGEYATNLEDGTYDISVEKTNYTTNGTTITVSGNPVTVDDIVLEQKKDISGTITADTGGGIAANIDVYENDTLVAETTANDGGGYTVGNLTKGTYTILANKSGYINASTTAELGTSSVSDVDITLTAYGVSGQVIACAATDIDCNDPKPVPDGTVIEYYGVDESKLEVADNKEARAKEIRDRMWQFNKSELDWKKYRNLEDSVFDTDQQYVAVHDPDDWEETGDEHLDSPTVNPSSDEAVALSVWDGSKGGGWNAQDGADNSLPGAIVDDRDIVIKQLNYRGNVQDTDVVETTVTSSSGGPLSSDHDYARVYLPQGFYRVHPEGNNATAYTIAVGDPIQAINKKIKRHNERLNETANELTERAKEIRELEGNGTVVSGTTRTYTDARGRSGMFNFTLDNKNVNVLAVQAYTPVADKYAIKDLQNASINDIRELYANGSYNGTFYVTKQPQDVSIPQAGAKIETVEISAAPLADMGRFDNLSSWLNDYFANNSQLFSGAPLDVENWESFLDLRNRFIGIVENSSAAKQYLAEEYPEYANTTGGETTLTLERVNASDTENVSRQDVRDYVTQTKALGDAVRHAPMELDPESIEQSVDERVAYYSDTIMAGRVLTSFENVDVVATFADGSTEVIPTQDLSLNTLAAADSSQVAIDRYEVPSGKDMTGVRIQFAEAAEGTLDAEIENAERTISEEIAVPMDISKSDTDVTVNFEDGTQRTLDGANWSVEDHAGPGATIVVDEWTVPAGKTAVTPLEVNTQSVTEVGATLNETNWLDSTVTFTDGSLVGGPSFDPSDVVVLAKYNGKQEEIGQEYWSINEQTVGPDQIEIQDYPLPPDVANVNVEVVAAGDAGLGRTEFGVDNPGFTGQEPGIKSIPISTLTPGPNEQVSFELTPADRALFGNVTAVEVRSPSGEQLAATVENGTVEFETDGAGAHSVRVQYTAADGSEFGTVFDVTAAEQPLDAPATLTARSGTNDLYALAGDQLTEGQVDLSGSTTVEVAGRIGTDDEIPTEVHLHLEGVEEATRGQTTATLVRGANGQGVQDHVTYTIHTQGIPEDAYVYRGETPIPEDGIPDGEVTHNGSYTVITLVSDADASVTYRVVRNPDFTDRIQWRIRLALERINLPVLFLTPTDLGNGGAVVGVLFIIGHRRRRGRGGVTVNTPSLPDPLRAD
ncbi:carboxypeptidase-like regulatory domain-containing protein [Halostella litorea]|uniref:carboxypeptidase-like regulatory domain-containing protein n=1 Tax=Halostella litorea TaxID=2528831 RepID=UPI002174D2A7|nr:carboxypeptidase-like regulatory domain-containing protein [Halostella litorea]